MKLPHVSIHYGSHLRPARDWTMLLIISLIILVLSTGSNIWFFEHVVNGGTLGEAPVVAPSIFSQDSLSAIEKIFADRAAEEGKYANGAYHFIDPSK